MPIAIPRLFLLGVGNKILKIKRGGNDWIKIQVVWNNLNFMFLWRTSYVAVDKDD